MRGVSVRGVQIFRGIPYGRPVDAGSRFLPPGHPAKWTGVRECVAPGPKCFQNGASLFSNPTIGGYFKGGKERPELALEKEGENCLTLNVLTAGTRGKRPVMCYLHGGGFTGGCSMLSLFGDGLVREQDVVLVGVNHRINVFGYLYVGGLSPKYQVGNVGHLDLVLALEWIRDNISRFGGDPGNVTIWGESGGGGKVNALMAMPKARGLFHKAIVESGSMLKAATPEAGTAVARAVLKKAGMAESQVDDFAKLPMEKLWAAGNGSGLGPVVDGQTLPHQTWDPKAPSESAGIPMIIGNCKDESTLFTPRTPAGKALFHLDATSLRGAVIQAGIPVTEVDALLGHYRRDHPADTPTDTYFRISSDRGARHNVNIQASLKLDQGGANVYLYQFVWNTPNGAGRLRAFHTAELPLVMRVVEHAESEELSKRISGAWAAFARTGNPSSARLQWPAYTVAKRATMIVDGTKCEAVEQPDQDELAIVSRHPSGNGL